MAQHSKITEIQVHRDGLTRIHREHRAGSFSVKFYQIGIENFDRLAAMVTPNVRISLEHPWMCDATRPETAHAQKQGV